MLPTTSLFALLFSISAPLVLATPIQTTGTNLNILRRDVSGGFFCCCSGTSQCVVNVDLNCDLTLANVRVSDEKDGSTDTETPAEEDPGKGGGTEAGDGADAEEPGKDID